MLCSRARPSPRRLPDSARRPHGSSHVPALSFDVICTPHRVADVPAPRSGLTPVVGRCHSPRTPGSLYGRWSRCCAAGDSRGGSTGGVLRRRTTARRPRSDRFRPSLAACWLIGLIGLVRRWVAGIEVWQGQGSAPSDSCQCRARAEPASRPIACLWRASGVSALKIGAPAEEGVGTASTEAQRHRPPAGVFDHTPPGAAGAVTPSVEFPSWKGIADAARWCKRQRSLASE